MENIKSVRELCDRLRKDLEAAERVLAIMESGELGEEKNLNIELPLKETPVEIFMEAVAGLQTDFSSKDIARKIVANGKKLKISTLANLLFKFNERGWLKIVAERQGRRGAKYQKTPAFSECMKEN